MHVLENSIAHAHYQKTDNITSEGEFKKTKQKKHILSAVNLSSKQRESY